MLYSPTQFLFGNFERDLKNELLQKHCVLLIDENVFHYHKNLFDEFYRIIIPSGEKFKNMQTVEDIYKELIGFEIDRSSMIVGIAIMTLVSSAG